MSETDRQMQEEYLTEIDRLDRRVQSLEKTVENLLKVLGHMNHYYTPKKDVATKEYVKAGFLSHLNQKH